ncbi:MAG: hypothetical protein RJA46_1405 [Pseudomonadota bacterium]
MNQSAHLMTTKQPHIIFIITDQQRYDTIAGLGYPHMETPNLDRLIQEGTHFTQCHVAGASCVPARSSLFTGYYAHTTGILKNADTWRHTWVENLAQVGYTCINVGKMHTWPLDTSAGYHQRYVVENKDRFLEGRFFFDDWDRSLAARGLVKQQRVQYRQFPDYRERLGAFEWLLPTDSHSDNFVADRACWWIDTAPKAEPLFLQIGFPGPHPPYDPTPEYLDRYMGKQLPIAKVNDSDLAGQPQPFHELRQHNVEIDHDSVVHQLEPSDEHRHRQRAHYMANVTMIDDAVGKILASLEKKGYLDDCIIVFTSDHGDCLGDHGHSQKWTMYEQVTKVPMILWAPGKVPAAQAKLPEGIEAESVEPAFKDPSWAGRDAVFCEQGRDNILTEVQFMTMVRTQRWKLVHFLNESFGQLFDLENDPDENNNLWSSQNHCAVRQELMDKLLLWRMESQIKTQNVFREHR